MQRHEPDKSAARINLTESNRLEHGRDMEEQGKHLARCGQINNSYTVTPSNQPWRTRGSIERNDYDEGGSQRHETSALSYSITPTELSTRAFRDPHRNSHETNSTLYQRRHNRTSPAQRHATQNHRPPGLPYGLPTSTTSSVVSSIPSSTSSSVIHDRRLSDEIIPSSDLNSQTAVRQDWSMHRRMTEFTENGSRNRNFTLFRRFHSRLMFERSNDQAQLRSYGNSTLSFRSISSSLSSGGFRVVSPAHEAQFGVSPVKNISKRHQDKNQSDLEERNTHDRDIYSWKRPHILAEEKRNDMDVTEILDPAVDKYRTSTKTRFKRFIEVFETPKCNQRAKNAPPCSFDGLMFDISLDIYIVENLQSIKIDLEFRNGSSSDSSRPAVTMFKIVSPFPNNRHEIYHLQKGKRTLYDLRRNTRNHSSLEIREHTTTEKTIVKLQRRSAGSSVMSVNLSDEVANGRSKLNAELYRTYMEVKKTECSSRVLYEVVECFQFRTVAIVTKTENPKILKMRVEPRVNLGLLSLSLAAARII